MTKDIMTGIDNDDYDGDVIDGIAVASGVCFFYEVLITRRHALKRKKDLDSPLPQSFYDELATAVENTGKRFSVMSGRSQDEDSLASYVLHNFEVIHPVFLKCVAAREMEHGGPFSLRELIPMDVDDSDPDAGDRFAECLLATMFIGAFTDCIVSPNTLLYTAMIPADKFNAAIENTRARIAAKDNATRGDATYLPINFLRTEEGYLLTMENAFMNRMAAITSRKKISMSSGTAMDAPGICVFLDDMKAAFGVSEHKLLVAAVNIFLQENHTGRNAQPQNLRMIIPTDQLAELCGVILPDPATAATEQDAAKLKRARQKKVFKFVETMGPHLENLGGRFSWEEKGKVYRTMTLITGEMKPDKTRIDFTLEFAEYLINKSLTQYPEALLKLDGRYQAAYVLGVNIFDHMNMYSNIKAGTANRLKVTTLLRYASNQIPSIEEVRYGPSKRSYHSRIQKPLEEALWKLVDVGALHDWHYCGKNGKHIADEKFTDAKDMIYEEWEKLLVEFIPEKPIDHSQRIKELDAAKPTTKKKRGRPRKQLDAPAGS